MDIVLIVRKGWKSKIDDSAKVASIFLTKNLFSENVEWWADVCNEIDIVIHAAWYAEPGKYLLSDKNKDCQQGTISMAKGAVSSGVKKFVGIGTCLEYDLTEGMLSINTPLRPLSPYAASKAAVYLSLSKSLEKQDVAFSWCRLFYLFGEGEDCRRLVPYIKSQLEDDKKVELTSGHQIRDFMNVSDAGKQIADVALGKNVGAINICSGIPVTVRELAENIASEYGKIELLQFGVRSNNYMDPPCVVGIVGEKAEK